MPSVQQFLKPVPQRFGQIEFYYHIAFMLITPLLLAWPDVLLPFLNQLSLPVKGLFLSLAAVAYAYPFIGKPEPSLLRHLFVAPGVFVATLLFLLGFGHLIVEFRELTLPFTIAW